MQDNQLHKELTDNAILHIHATHLWLFQVLWLEAGGKEHSLRCPLILGLRDSTAKFVEPGRDIGASAA